MTQEFRIYKPNKQGSGAASKFSTRADTKSKFHDQLLFVETSAQIGTDENDNDRFDWKTPEKSDVKSVTMKLGIADVGAILATIKGRQKEAKLFHQNQNGNTALTLNYYNGQLSWNISSQTGDKLVKLRHSISLSEAVVLEILLERFVLLQYQWV